MKLDSNGDPMVTTESVDGATIEEVDIKLINKEYNIDENLNISMSFDVAKIPTSELTTVFDTVEKLGKQELNYFHIKSKKKLVKN